MRPLILLSNDDGFRSPGLAELREALSGWADTVTVAPETEQSAMSHSLSLHRPLRPRMIEETVFSIDGTPADCVYVALHALGRFLPRRPDLVVSGINRGLNLGQDAFYSGTVAAAREGALRGICALASSAHVDADLIATARLTSKLAERLLAEPKEAPRPLLSLNVPRDWNGSVRATRLGARIYEEAIEFRRDPRGGEYLWIGGSGVRHERGATVGAPSDGALETDTDADDDGAASLTSLVLDMTRHSDAGMSARLVAGL